MVFTSVIIFMLFIMSVCSNNPKIIIVGAGPSGIAAATRLYEKGFHNFIILEAENRYGGRIFTAELEGNLIDIGAQWCHGEKDNVVYELANPLNLLGSSNINHTLALFGDSSKKIVPDEQSLKYAQIFDNILENHDEMKLFNGSLGDFVLKQIHEGLKTKFNNTDKLILNKYMDWYRRLQNTIDGSNSWFDASAYGQTVYKECPGNQALNWKGRGYRTILDILMKKIPDSNKALPIEEKIIFGKEVSLIKIENGHVSLKCIDGSQYIADHVIITVSLGVLKERMEYLFSPELPYDKKRAVEGLGFDTVNKIILKFPFTWWPKNVSGFNLLWNEEDKNNITNIFGGNDYENDWLTDVLGFYPVEHQNGTLIGWLSGVSVKKSELISDIIIKQKCVSLLRHYFGNYYQIPDASTMIRSKWYSNSHFRGSYSFRSMQSEEFNISAGDLAKPLINANNVPVILFAGEATHDYYYSTVHGAIETGWREADRIIQFYK